jgi:cytochrome o ubiquinol oxidase subunit 2
VRKKLVLKIIIATLLAVAIIVAAWSYFKTVNVAVLNPQGTIANQERGLIIFTVILSLVVVIPVFTLLGVIAWKYREKNTKKTTYKPNWDSSRLFETIWWGIPCVIILILCVVTWQTSHQLDPYKSLNSDVKPLNVQVVALQWKWLFIYPDQHVASVNLLEIPEKTPINFQITSDAPMNAFWIPNLGSQVYAMSGMSAQLHLMADAVGDYPGSSSNISGTHFADMKFTARAVRSSDFDQWVGQAQQSSPLAWNEYKALSQPGVQAQPISYDLTDQNLYSEIIAQYQQPPAKKTDTQPEPQMNMEGM